MRVSFTMDAVLLGVTSRDYVSQKTGKPGTIYNVGVKQSGGISELNATPELFEAFQQGHLKEFAPYKFDCEYDTDFRNFRVLGVVASK